jgi:CRP-like cAMP-binding protein
MERAGVLEANRLLALLPSAALGMMLPHLSIVSLAAGAALSDDVYFMLDGLVAMFVATSEGQLLYTGLVGKDDAVGLTELGNSISLIRTAVLAPGTAAKISRSNFHDVWSRNAALRELQVRYSELMLGCAHQTAACNAVHDSRKRLCTWLLRAHDRLPGERLPFTQQLLADMIGVRRSTVTFFAHDLQNEGILRYTRGNINVVNRAELEQQACECYGITQRLHGWCFSTQLKSD